MSFAANYKKIPAKYFYVIGTKFLITQKTFDNFLLFRYYNISNNYYYCFKKRNLFCHKLEVAYVKTQ